MKNRVSRIFQLASAIPKDAKIKSEDGTSKSQKLLLDLGLIRPAANGTYHILPLVQKSIEKLEKLVDECMQSAGGQKLNLPILTSTELWKKSGRLDDVTGELFKARDSSGKDLILSPTHEESIASLLASTGPISYKRFPLRLYQIGMKFRDELKPRFGLIRAKEFLMKDLYSFDVSPEAAEETYQELNELYVQLFQKLKIPWIRVKGDSGMMGGDKSHEFHVLADIGEDNILQCTKCNYLFNEKISRNCLNCSSSELSKSKGIEVGHTFLLGTKYSKPLDAKFLTSKGTREDLIMGSYGIGITRLIAASLEALSSDTELRWPLELVPYKICIIPPKEGSKEQTASTIEIEKLLPHLTEVCNDQEDSIVFDDRTDLTIGKRLLEAKRTGYPIIIVAGARTAVEIDPTFELHSTYLKEAIHLKSTDLLVEIKDILSKN